MIPDSTAPAPAPDWPELERRARASLAHSWSPYSRFRVAAALLCGDGSIFIGVNVECRSYGLTTCAERSALAMAISAGHRKFRALLILGEAGEPLAPCGACRQLLAEFSTDLPIRLCGDHSPVDLDLPTLLPLANSGLRDL